MWILLRLIAMAIGFVARHLSWSRKREDNQSHHGIAYSEITSRHKGRVVKFEISVPLETGLVFVFTPEGGGDRFFKRLGLTEEFQTGDDSFDEKTYVGSDHPVLLNVLRGDRSFREIVGQMLAAGFFRVWSDGHRLFAESRDEKPASAWVGRLAQLKSLIEAASRSSRGRLADPFAARVLLVEALVWSIAGYAAVAYFQVFGDVGSHFSGLRLILPGLFVAVVTFAALLGVIVLILERSSRSHRVLVESQILLLLSLPVLGIETVADINRRLDVTPPVMVEVRVEEKWTTTSRRRRGGTRTHYHARLTSLGEITVPSPLKVPAGIYSSLVPGRSIGVEVGAGRLGFPYFRSVNGIEW